MSSPLSAEAYLLKTLPSPRPPAVGEEVKGFHDASCRNSEPCKNSSKMEVASDEAKSGAMDSKEKVVILETTSVVDAATASARNPSPPPTYKWAQSLQCLLHDVKGVDLFEQFLQQEGHDTKDLTFWFGCQGVKKTDHSDRHMLYKRIKVLYEKLVKKIDYITTKTKKDIAEKLSSRNAVDFNIFNAAQLEVEQHLLKTTYPNFLSSDLYLMHLGKDNVQSESAMEVDGPLSPEAMDLLPTLHEDSELSVSVIKAAQNKDPLLARPQQLERRKPLHCKVKPENQAGVYLKSPYGSYIGYHTRYSSYLPASAVDSELQSLSSDALTDDTMSLTDSSIDHPMHRSKKRQPKMPRYIGSILNKERHSHQTFVPRTQRPATENMMKRTPEEFHAILVDKLQKVLKDQKAKEEMNERLKAMEAKDYYQSDNVVNYSNKAPLDSRISMPGTEDEPSQEILDNHVDRVFADTGLTPITMSPGCTSPSVAKAISEDNSRFVTASHSANDGAMPDLPYCAAAQRNGRLSYGAPYAARYRRDPDTISNSNDSGAMTEWISEDNLQVYHKGTHFSSSENIDYSQIRRNRDQLKRCPSLSKKCSSIPTDSASSCVDSGISIACESVLSHSKVAHWLEKRSSSEPDKDYQWKTSSTSPVLSRSSSSRKAVGYNSSRSVAMEGGSAHWPLVPAQPIAQDPCMPALPPPDTTSNLMEARRRLEDESRSKAGKLKYPNFRNPFDMAKGRNSFRACDTLEDNPHRKQSKKLSSTSLETSSTVGSGDNTIIGYSYGRDSVPYKSKLPGKNVTLRQFKSLLSKKGNFRYFFKRISDDFGTGVVLEEVTDDSEVLPLWEGKIFCIIEAMDEGSASNDCL